MANSNYKLGVSTGLYTIARSEELASSMAKLGFALTRGVSAIEIAGDVPHEVTQTDGTEIRHVARKQGIDVLFHGSLTVPMCIPERGDYRDAENHMKKSILSAIHCGSRYVNFHSCLNIWLELMTYAGRKLTMSFCDHEGNFISHILKGDSTADKRMRKWFIEQKGEIYIGDILTRDRRIRLNSEVNIQVDRERKEEIRDSLFNILNKRLPQDIPERDKQINKVINDALATGIPPSRELDKIVPGLGDEINDLYERIRERAVLRNAEIEKKITNDTLDSFLAVEKRWYSEELRGPQGIIDGYHIMAHWMFFHKDPMWVEMVRVYKNVLDRYNLDYSNPLWLDDAWKQAEDENDREFKEFFYAVVAAKFLEGHTKRVLRWLENGLIDEYKALPEKTEEERREKSDLLKAAKDIMIVYESPDARDPSHAGMFLLWNPKQVYAAVKAIRKSLSTERVWLLMDFEHVATQGLDPVKDFEETTKMIPDYGNIVYAVHSNAPNPMHAHEPLEIGDVKVYTLLWLLRKTGFGKNRKVYVIYERGGGKDPFVRSVESLRHMVKYIEQDILPANLPVEFFGMVGPVAGDYKRQWQIIQDHKTDPLKDLLEMPEEEWGILSQGAVKKGKRPEVWKKGEMR